MSPFLVPKGFADLLSAWKQFERDAAALFGGGRFWANSGERLDFEGVIQKHEQCPLPPPHGHKIHGQCKLVKSLSLEALTKLAEEPGVDVVCVKVRRGSGKSSPPLVVMTFENYRRLHG